MALSADQRAMLELLLERGQSYDDLSSLLDLTEAEVHARARAALTELGGADPDRSVGLTDYLLGQADPIGRADAVRHLKEDPDDHRLAAELIDALGGIAPGAELPKLPAAPGGGRFLRRAPAGEPEPSPKPAEAGPPSHASPRRRGPRPLSGLNSSQTRLIVGLGSAAVILIAVVLGVTGAFGGDGDEGSGATAASTTSTGADQTLEQVDLKASDGGDASGTATFGIATGDQAFVDLDISKLEPAPQGKAYIFWLMISNDQGHPLQPFQVNQDGSYSQRIPIQSFLNELAARTQFVDVSLSEQKPLLKAVNQAVNSETPTPIIPYSGESILRGDVQPTGQ